MSIQCCFSVTDTSRNKAPKAEGNHAGWLSVGRAMSGFARWGGGEGSQHRWNFVRDLSTEPAAWESGGKLHPWQAFTLRKENQFQKANLHWDHSACFTCSPSAPPRLQNCLRLMTSPDEHVRLAFDKIRPKKAVMCPV